MVKLRMKRLGRRNRAFYRLCAMDGRTRRDGRPIEELGIYDPVSKDPTKQLVLNTERVAYWLSVGAQPSDTVVRLVTKAGIELPKKLIHRRELIRKQKTAQLARKAAVTAQKQAAAAARAEADAGAKAAKEAAKAAEAPAAAPAEETKA